MKTKEELIKLMFESDKSSEGVYYQSVDLSDRIVVTYILEGVMKEKKYTISDFVTFVHNMNIIDDYGALDMD